MRGFHLSQLHETATPFEEKLQFAWPLDRWRDRTVLIAVSGGADSIALLRGLHALRRENPGEGRLIVAHFNHQLRGDASSADEAAVRSLANQLRLEHAIGHAATDLTANSPDGLEAAARQARYDFLAQIAGELGARFIATAHTADDQVETILFNVLRGTGLSGLAGIPRTRQLTAATTIIRPLLDFTRTEILAYLSSLNQSFRDDETNQCTDFTRNRIRHELLPHLERSYNPRVRNSLLRLSQAAAQADDFLTQQAQSILGIAARLIPGGFELDKKRLAHLHPALIRQMLLLIWQDERWPLQDMSFEKWERLVELCLPPTGETTSQCEALPGKIRVEANRETLRITRG